MLIPKKSKIVLDVSVLFFFCIVSFPFPTHSEESPAQLQKKKFTESIKNLKNKSAGERRKAAEELGRSNNPEAVGPLLRCLDDKDEGVRNSVAYALGLLRDERAVKPLMNAAEKDPPVRIFAIRSLGFLKNPKSLPVLKTMLRNDNPNVVFEAAFALGQFNKDDMAVALMEAINSTEDYGCQSLVDVLKKKEVREAESLLVDIVDHSQLKPRCALSAASALGWLGGSYTILHFKRILKKSIPRELQMDIIKTLGRLQARDAFPDVLPFLNDLDPQLTKAVIESFAGIGDRAAIPYIRRLSQSQDPGLKDAAKYALEQFGVE